MDTFISHCPDCDMLWRNVYSVWAKKAGIDDEINAKHYNEVSSGKIKVVVEIKKSRLDEAIEAGAEKVLALYICCEFQLRVAANKKKIPIKVLDPARYAVTAMGFEFTDPNLEVKK